MKSKASIALLVALLIWETFCFGSYLAIVQAPATRNIPMADIPSGGRIIIEGLDIFWNSNKTDPVTSVDWGALRPGENTTRLVYIVNIGNCNSTIQLWTGNYSSQLAEQYLSLSWNYTGEVLGPGSMAAVNLILTVDSEIHDVYDYSFDIGISIAWIED